MTRTLTPTATRTLLPTPTFAATPDSIERLARVPILMYHYISEPPDPKDAIRVDLSVPPERFAEHLHYLYVYGYTTISLDDLARSLSTGAPLPDKPIILTFDDGYVDHYEHAYRLLSRYRMTGTFFLISGFIDEGRDGFLSWDQAIEMYEGGMTLGAHSFTHPDLRNRDDAFLVWQTLGPREAIEARTGDPVRWFCYPSGRYDDQVIHVLQSANYWGAVTTMSGIEHRSDGLFELLRVRVRGTMSGPELLGILESQQTSDPGPIVAPPMPIETVPPRPTATAIYPVDRHTAYPTPTAREP